MRKQRPGPFALQVRDIAHLPGEMREFTIDVPSPEKLGEGLVSVAEGAEIAIDARAESVHEGILVSGIASTNYTGVCGRCLDDIDAAVEVEFQELFAYPEKETTDFEVQDDHVDLETLVRDAIVLSLPFQPVCQPDCPGLDPVTGERLAVGTENPQRESTDSRWAALQDYTPDHDDDGPRLTADRVRVENTEES